MSNKDGGPAFPVALGSQPDQHLCATGMSLRDYFAGQAIVCVLADSSSSADDIPRIAAAAYLVADAMLAEREKGRD